MRTFKRTIFMVLGLLGATPVFAQSVDWQQVDAALGAKGSMQAGDVYKFGLARSDLDVTLDGVKLEPAFALGSWLAFKQEAGRGTVVMGDLVLLESEVAAVMMRLESGGIEATALHNHLLRARPFPVYMHVEGMGDAVALAKTLHAALAATGTPLQAAPAPARAAGALDTGALDRIMGRKGSTKGDVVSYSIPRAEPIKMSGMTVPPSMGTAIGINFEPTGNGAAATTGDLVLKADEVAGVERALQANGIEIMALHSHMLEEQPRLFFMHFWGHGDPEKLARGLKAALDRIGTERG